jgi:hypothetical protein
MEPKEVIQNGRKYKAYVSPDEQMGAYAVIGPPESLVDELGLPEPFATRLHNILYERGIMCAKDATRPNAIAGALQEAYQIDAQKIVEQYFLVEKEGAQHND